VLLLVCAVQYNQYKTPMENIGLQDSLLSRFDLLFIVLDIVRYLASFEQLSVETRDVTEPANMHIHRMRISCAKSVGFRCRYGFVAQSKLSAIMATVVQLIYLKLSSCKRTSSEQL